MTLENKAEQYARKCHEETNHRYDGKPYAVHLEMVVGNARKYLDLIPEDNREEVIAACWVHDCIEDCRQTYNDVKKATSEQVAEIAYALTTEKGKTRAERAGEKYYEGIRNTPFATFVKICDRMANLWYSLQTNSRMATVYKAEMPMFERHLQDTRYEPMWADLRKMAAQI